jgi:hypothetical protein
MKNVFLTIIAVIITVNLILSVLAYREKAAELATIERIELITENITNDALCNELESMTDEELTAVLGL